MNFAVRTFLRIGARHLVFYLLALAAATGTAQEFRFDSAGARVGVGANNASRVFHQAEAFVNWDLPWRYNLATNWRLESELEFSAGWLGDSFQNAAVVTLGPVFFLGRGHLPVWIEAGSSPTFISRHEFASKDVGTLYQFTSHGGVNWDVTSHLRFGYRFQHMSNAGISSRNPGLNLHLFALSYSF